MAEQSNDFPLLSYLDGRVEDLRKQVTPALRGEDEDAVHDARVATRRLKAATDLLAPVVSGRCKKPFDKVTKTLRRQLGPLRDLDVMLGHLREMKQEKFAGAAEWLQARLTDCRRNAVKRAKDHAPPSRMLAKLGTWWGLRQEISEAEAAVESLLAESVHLRLDAFAEQADELIRVQEPKAPAAGKSPRRVDPHELRIAGKSLRYTLEMAKEQGVILSKAIMVLFKRMQDHLGLWHDYIVLSERMLSEVVECELSLHDPELVGQILLLAEATLTKGQIQLKKVSEAWKEHGEDLSRRLRQAFPLTRPASKQGPVSKPIVPAQPISIEQTTPQGPVIAKNGIDSDEQSETTLPDNDISTAPAA